MGSAWVTARLGLHPVFGAFLAGLTLRGSGGVPDADVLRFLDGAANLLLPLFTSRVLLELGLVET
jgi:Kef-type K+ transport system membrane component KefB